jgi:hypothetical protein
LKIQVEVEAEAVENRLRVISRVCICCGESFSYPAYLEVSNPNICETCSHMAGVDECESQCAFEKSVAELAAGLSNTTELQNAS